LNEERKDKSSKGISSVLNSNKNLRVFPNPSNSIANVLITIDKLAFSTTLTLSGIDGRTIKTYPLNVGSNTISVDTQELGSGIYFLSVNQLNGKTITEKLIVVKQ
jgi:hypothetical protein